MTWEYVVQDIDRAKRKPPDLQADLNELGEDDWELVSVMKMTGTIDRYFLKRPVRPESLGGRVTSLFHREGGAGDGSGNG